jgi:hypothetical protein
VSAEELLAELRARGATVTTVAGRLRVEAPKGALTPDLRTALEARRGDLLKALGGGPAPAVEQLLALPLDRFAEARQLLQVHVRWWPESLWFVPSSADAEDLRREGVSRGRVWTARELADLLAIPGLSRDAILTAAQAKLAFGGEVVGVREARAAHATGRVTARPEEAPA